jgi:hypothetical protein
MAIETDQQKACDATGFVLQHAKACQAVAQRVNTIILFREPGRLARGLIEENYNMKGFRIDTKSCNWGPMAGFVCVDPRFTKDPKYHEKNAKWTVEALSGHINEEYFGDQVRDSDWTADVMPIVISLARIKELAAEGIINPILVGPGEYTTLVNSTEVKNGTYATMLWVRMVSTWGFRRDWLRGAVNHFVLCIDNERGFTQFRQRYPSGVRPITYRGRETVLGMINPGTKDRGFKACVTADYDLFAIGPYMKYDFSKVPKLKFDEKNPRSLDTMAHKHKLMIDIQNYVPKGFGKAMRDRRYLGVSDQRKFLSGNVPRLGSIDMRLSQSSLTADQVKAYGPMVKVKIQDEKMQQEVHSLHEHHRFGDVSARVMLIKTLLNSALFGGVDREGGGREGGNAVHHNDEAGNFALAKGTLRECMPLIGFTPISGFSTVLITSLQEFKEFVLMAAQEGYKMQVKPDWLAEAGLPREIEV